MDIKKFVQKLIKQNYKIDNKYLNKDTLTANALKDAPELKKEFKELMTTEAAIIKFIKMYKLLTNKKITKKRFEEDDERLKNKRQKFSEEALQDDFVYNDTYYADQIFEESYPALYKKNYDKLEEMLKNGEIKMNKPASYVIRERDESKIPLFKKFVEGYKTALEENPKLKPQEYISQAKLKWKASDEFWTIKVKVSEKYKGRQGEKLWLNICQFEAGDPKPPHFWPKTKPKKKIIRDSQEANGYFKALEKWLDEDVGDGESRAAAMDRTITARGARPLLKTVNGTTRASIQYAPICAAIYDEEGNVVRKLQARPVIKKNKNGKVSIAFVCKKEARKDRKEYDEFRQEEEERAIADGTIKPKTKPDIVPKKSVQRKSSGSKTKSEKKSEKKNSQVKSNKKSNQSNKKSNKKSNQSSITEDTISGTVELRDGIPYFQPNPIPENKLDDSNYLLKYRNQIIYDLSQVIVWATHPDSGYKKFILNQAESLAQTLGFTISELQDNTELNGNFMETLISKTVNIARSILGFSTLDAKKLQTTMKRWNDVYFPKEDIVSGQIPMLNSEQSIDDIGNKIVLLVEWTLKQYPTTLKNIPDKVSLKLM